MHERCALWSHGVRQKKETSIDEAMNSKGLSGLEEAVIQAAWQKCAHCRHYGASIKCRAGGSRFYHFPCGAASGSFMHKGSLTLVGAPSLAKVAGIVEANLKYLYHNGEWMSGRVADLRPEDFVNLLFCTKCGKHYFYTGAHVRITPVIRAGWQCQKCKWCQNCRQVGLNDRFLLCDVCDGAFHAHCLRPQMASIPKSGWKCKVGQRIVHTMRSWSVVLSYCLFLLLSLLLLLTFSRPIHWG